MQRPMAEPGTNCPLYKQDMSEVCHKCAWWTKLQGAHPQRPDVLIDEWGCAVAWLPIIGIEAAKEARGAGAATESMRNELMALAGFPDGHPQTKRIGSG